MAEYSYIYHSGWTGGNVRHRISSTGIICFQYNGSDQGNSCSYSNYNIASYIPWRSGIEYRIVRKNVDSSPWKTYDQIISGDIPVTPQASLSNTQIIIEARDIVTYSDKYVFKTGGAVGKDGPTQAQLDNVYNGTNLDEKVKVASGKQEWVVPKTGTYTIEASGAQGGGSYGGYGANIKGDFNLVAGDKLTIVVGQQGTVGANSNAGGGGASYVMKGTTSLIIAAGGGGTTNYSSMGGTKPGYGGEAGTSSSNVGDGSKGIGQGGKVGSGTGGAGGGGLNSAGDGNTYGTGGQSLYGTSIGGTGYNKNDYGGFGGGGAAGYSGGGGGGGYTGGSGGGNGAAYAAGGGGSYNSGINAVNTGGANPGAGEVIISLQGPPNTAPTQPSAFTAQPDLSSINLAGDTIRVQWNTSIDSENDAIRYELQFYNGTSWTTIASNLETNYHNYTLPNIDIENARFQVRAIDANGAASSYRASNVFTIRKYLILIQDDDIIKTYKNGEWQTI